MTPIKVPGRLLAWTALLVALGASVLANVAYARAELGPRLSAGTAPVLVVLAAGLLERVPLARARWWQRWLAGGGLVFVVLAAFVTSYQHQSALLRDYGNPALSSVLLPFAVDALIVMASICLAVIAERRRELAAPAPAAIETAPDLAEAPGQVSDIETDTPGALELPKRARRQPTTAQRVARLRQRQPDLPVSAIARKVGVTERTVSRHLAALAGGEA
jgi:DNA-binding transcriptional ArsR family regulator